MKTHNDLILNPLINFLMFRLSDIGSIVRDNSSRPKSKKMTSSRPRFFKDSIELSEDNTSEVEEEIKMETADE